MSPSPVSTPMSPSSTPLPALPFCRRGGNRANPQDEEQFPIKSFCPVVRGLSPQIGFWTPRCRSPNSKSGRLCVCLWGAYIVPISCLDHCLQRTRSAPRVPACFTSGRIHDNHSAQIQSFKAFLPWRCSVWGIWRREKLGRFCFWSFPNIT